jgi:outer membrane biosynthesis protein TonB
MSPVRSGYAGEEALKAARQWRFKPATRFGQPVAVYITIGVGFTMH